jgi:ABC-type hemin transport system ATPase subunit
MASVDLQQVREALEFVAFEAGRMILAANPSSISTDTKLNGMYNYNTIHTSHPLHRHISLPLTP